jgi:GT2 family glycosyltransferase
MAKLHIVVVAYNRPVALRGLIDSFLLQRKSQWDWSMTIVHDGPASEAVKKTVALYEDDPRVFFIETEIRVGNWGMANRRMMFQLINAEPGDFILNTNDDNVYVPFFLEFMMRETLVKNTAFVYCDFLHHNFDYDIIQSQPKINHIDMGAFITEFSLAKEINFPYGDDFPAGDGRFAEDVAEACRKRGLRIVRIPKVLFVHN